jgi:outer membrane lipoprotein SlyB
VLPAGTELSVRTNEAIESESAASGRTYSAQVDKEVRDSSGNVTIPRLSPVQLVVRETSEGGTVSSPELTLAIQSLTVNGRRFLVSTEGLERSGREGIGKNRRTAEMLGGGAALGTLLGAIAGGGKGAVIGAIAGAAAGGAVQVLTKGKEVKVPAETVLNFRLDQPMRLEMAR